MNLSEIIFLIIYGLFTTYAVRHYRRQVKDQAKIIAMYERHMTAHSCLIYKNGVRYPAEDQWPEEIEN